MFGLHLELLAALSRSQPNQFFPSFHIALQSVLFQQLTDERIREFEEHGPYSQYTRAHCCANINVFEESSPLRIAKLREIITLL